MRDLGNSGSGDATFYIIVSIVALVAIVVLSEWLRNRREREIYRQTQQNGRNTAAMIERQRHQRAAGN